MRLIRNLILTTFVVLTMLTWQMASADGTPEGVNVSIKLLNSEVSSTQEVLVEFTYENVTARSIRFLKWGTPFESRLNSDALRITHEGSILPYRGWHIKRAPALESDFMTLAAGTSQKTTVNLQSAYEIDLKGDYFIELKDPGMPEREEAAQKTAALKLTLLSDRPIYFKRTPTFSSCQDVPQFQSQRTARLDQAVADAEAIALKARNDLSNTPVSQRGNAARYRQWFGVYDLVRWNRVQSNFDKIFTAVQGQTINFVCEDDENFFAAVNPFNPYTIFVGRAFWSAPRLGTDSKAGTVVHELSHFLIVADTDDHVYGQNGARALATNNPNLAVDNADSNEYFAENTPFLAMPPPGIDPEPDPEVPDLVIRSISTTNQNPKVKETVSIAAVVSNVGQNQSAATQATLRLSNDDVISFDDLALEQAAVPALNAGTTSNFETDFPAPDEEGQFWVGVCVLSVSGETTIGNNCSIAVPLLVEPRQFIIPPLLLLLDDDED